MPDSNNCSKTIVAKHIPGVVHDRAGLRFFGHVKKDGRVGTIESALTNGRSLPEWHQGRGISNIHIIVMVMLQSRSTQEEQFLGIFGVDVYRVFVGCKWP
jgi:hypothetical protein